MNSQIPGIANQSSSEWLFESARHLRELYAPLRAKLDELAGLEAEDWEFESIEATRQRPTALGVLCSSFGLTRFERDVMVILAMMNLDTGLPSIFMSAFTDGVPAVNFLKLLDTFTEAAHLEQASLAPDGTLRRWELVRVSESQTMTEAALNTRTLVLDDWVYLYLSGIDSMDAILQGAIQSPNLERHLTLTEAQRVVSEHASQQFGHSLVQIWGIETDIKNAASTTTTLQFGYRLARRVGPAEVELSFGVQKQAFPVFYSFSFISGFFPIDGGRNDTRVFGNVDLYFPDYSYAGFAPVVTLSVGRTDSNVGRFERNDASISFAFRSTF